MVGHAAPSSNRITAVTVLLVCGLVATTAQAADLPYRPARPVYHVLPRAEPVETPPASSNGYYGYYGYDITGVPYFGLYSENASCIRSVRTTHGYETIDVC